MGECLNTLNTVGPENVPKFLITAQHDDGHNGGGGGSGGGGGGVLNYG